MKLPNGFREFAVDAIMAALDADSYAHWSLMFNGYAVFTVEVFPDDESR